MVITQEEFDKLQSNFEELKEKFNSLVSVLQTSGLKQKIDFEEFIYEDFEDFDDKEEEDLDEKDSEEDDSELI